MASGESNPSMLPVEPAALDYARIYTVVQYDPSLTGRGIRIAYICPSETYINNRPQNDYRINVHHSCLYDADVAFEDGSDGKWGLSSHETACAGILLGADEKAFIPDFGMFQYRGACPDASVDVYEFWRFAALYLFGKKPFEADIVTLSLGNIFEEWWTRGLEQAADEKDLLVIAGIGNGAGVHTPKPLYPAAGANILGVGVVDAAVDQHGTISLWDFSSAKAVHSSVGPTEDGRCKPDIIAPGTALVPSHTDNTGYVLASNWSSLSAPIVSGTAALLLQKAAMFEQNDIYNQPGKALLLKAILMNSARKLPFWHKGRVEAEDDPETPLDYIQGAGVIDGLEAYQQLTAGPGSPGSVSPVGWDNRMLDNTHTSCDYMFTAAEPNQFITATLCWNRVYQPHYPFNRLTEQDTDLRLELWAVNPNEPNQPILLDYSDSINDNIEHIYAACSPNYTVYFLRVRFNELQTMQNPVRQRFAVAWSVGPDRQAGNPWWYDLNGDDQIDATDQLIYAMLDSGMFTDADAVSLGQALNCTPERINLLVGGWDVWKRYLTNWELASDTPPAVDAQNLPSDVGIIQ
ncbi:MAG: S8 family serine peptidase [Phycisphaerae bacterium]|nr:S8 family serine peptidase [Phycisphaerae bacterium]